MIRVENRPTGEVLPWGIWVPNGSPVLPERRLLVPEPAIKFDKLTPTQMGEAHGKIAERPPAEIVDRLRGLRFLPDMGLYQSDENFVISGREYASAYAENIGIWLSKRGATEQDLERFNQTSLTEPQQLHAYINGMERVSYEHSRFIYPEGYVLGFAVGVTRDFGLPINLIRVPDNDLDYNAFLAGLSGADVPKYSSAMWSGISERLGFQLGVDIHEIVEAESSPQAA